MSRSTLLFLFLLLQTCPVLGQSLDSLRVSLNVQGTSLPAVFGQLEAQHRLRFYYAGRDLPQRLFSARFDATPLPDVLRQLLKDTGLGFFFYRNYAVAVAPATVIQTGYSPDFYTALKEIGERPDERPENAPQTANAFVVGEAHNIRPDGQARIKGTVTDAQNGEPIARVAVQWTDLPGKFAYTDARGLFEITVPVGVHSVKIQQVGYALFEAEVRVFNDGDLLLKIVAANTTLAEALVRAEASDVNISSARIGVTKLEPKTIKRLPTLLGEADVVRSLLLSTGVTSAGEGAAGFNVRGGEIDHNLMLQDEVVLFNSTHALGFFSTYNTDLVQSVELHKSILPAQYGGRLASVLDVQMRDGSFEKWKIKGGVGPVSGRLAVEGPVWKDKSSLAAGVRASYSDWVLRLFKQPELKKSSASFYDANIRYTHRLNAKNTLTLSGYLADDVFVYNQQFGFDYRTLGGQLTHKYFFKENAFSRLSLVVGDYNSTQTDFEGSDGGELANGIRYVKVKEQITWHIRRSLQVDAGLEAIHYRVQPGKQSPRGQVSAVAAKSLETEHGLESALFGSVEWGISTRWTIIGGLRLNHYRFLGPKTVFQYDPVIAPENVSDTVFYGAWETIARHWNFEPRVSGLYRLDQYSSLKAGYSRTSQFVNQIFNTDSPTPTSQYQLSTPYLEPFRSHNFAAGYFRNTRGNEWELSAEAFYRAIDRSWDYRDFARLTVNEQLETEIRSGKGRAYGFECSAKTSRPRINGQVGYTFSRAERKIPGISQGNWYPSNFDKPHVLNLVVNYQPNQRHTLTFQFTYSTGRPTTVPLTSYRLQNNIIVPVYGPRNQGRIPDFHRLDVSYTIGRGYNKRKTLKTSWNFSIYNVYARRNAFSVFFVQDPDQKPVANRLAILGSVFPAITLNIETL